MKEYTIGIKTGDGQFYPVMEESFKGKKRFVLTTVNDNQSSVQIDFYRSLASRMEDADYIGSLVIEDIDPAPRKDPEIEVVLGVDTERNLHAVARNLASDDRQSLTVSLEALGSDLTYDIPEFEMGSQVEPSDIFEEEDSDLTGDSYPLSREDRRKAHLEKKKNSPLRVALLILLGLALVGGLTFGIFFLINRLSGQEKDSLSAGNVTPEPTALPELTASPSPVPSPEPAALYTGEPEKVIPLATPRTGGFTYTVKKGDTLWDIAEKFYGDPWAFYKIYSNNLNKIPYPGLIYIGTKLYIP